jgi:thiol:disulfide interchange protein
LKLARKPARLILLIAVFSALAFWMILWPQPKELIPWRNNYAAAAAESHQTGKPLFLYFTATWCGPCQSLRATTWADRTVAAELAGYVPVKLDVDDQSTADLQRQYHVNDMGIPFFVILDKSGNLVRSDVGARPPEDFLRWFKGQEHLN